MYFTALKCCVAVGTLILSIQCASAAIITATIEGKLESGQDLTLVFGSYGDLTGKNYSLEFTYDTVLGNVQNSLFGQYIFSGSTTGTPQAVSAILTIAGVSTSLFNKPQLSGSSGNVVTSGSPGFGLITNGVTAFGFDGTANVENTVNLTWTNDSPPSTPWLIATPFVSLGAGVTDGRFLISERLQGLLYYREFAAGVFGPGTLTIEVASEVPLPAALPLFASAIMGGGVIAWRKRRKQKAEALAA